MDVLIFIGLQGAGKSTFFQRYLSSTHGYVSRDTFPNNKRPAHRQQQLIEEALQERRSVVIDNTNPTVEARAAIIQLAHAYHATVIGYYFESSVKESLERNKQREGKARVPPVAIYATAKKLAPPSFSEGFERIYTVRIESDGGFSVKEWAQQNGSSGEDSSK